MSEESFPFRGLWNDEAVYRPLQTNTKEIRYLSVQPGSGDAEVVCSLEYASVHRERRVRYEALSYTWGDLKETVHITLRYKSVGSCFYKDVKFEVSLNLDRALKNLKYKDRRRSLWVDAICINQMDPTERTQQVELMGEIYESSVRVVVWLGEPDVFSNIAMQLVKKLPPLIKIQFKSHSEISAMLKNIEALGVHDLNVDSVEELNLRDDLLSDQFQGLKRLLPIAFMGDLEMREDICRILALMDMPWQSMTAKDQFGAVAWIIHQCVDELFARPWFRRVWVVQEVFRAPVTLVEESKVVLHLGSHSIFWAELCYFVDTFATYRQLHAGLGSLMASSRMESFIFFRQHWHKLSEYMKPPYRIARKYGTVGFPLPILGVLAATKNFQATDPRDKLFAMLHLAQNTQNFHELDGTLRPDYHKSTADVVADFVCWEMRRTRTLDMFFYMDPHRVVHPGSPSWIPDILESKGDWSLAEVASDLQSSDFKSCMGTEKPRTIPGPFEINGSSLTATGVVLSFVRKVVPHALGFDPYLSMLSIEIHGEEWDILPYLWRHYWNPATSDSQFFINCLLMFGCFRTDSEMAPGFVRYVTLFQHPTFVDQESWYAFIKLEGDQGLELGSLSEFCDPARSLMENRRLFECEDGAFGVCPITTQVNDVVVALEGSKLPLLLRPVGASYRLVGPCLFHGGKWTEGEAGRHQAERKLPMQTFELI